MPKAYDVEGVTFSVPDLDAQAAFLREFGFQDVEVSDAGLKAYGAAHDRPIYTATKNDAAFQGFSIVMDENEFDDLMKGDVPDASEDGSLRLVDPDGFEVTVIRGREAEQNAGEGAAWNEAGRPTRHNRRLSVTPAPSRIRRLGHVVLNVKDFVASAAFYERHFGLLRSDEITLPGTDMVIGSFFRMDRGSDPTDHHSLFLLQGPGGKFEHAAFEVQDFNDLMTGHDHLRASGADASWGVGRHILGSHVFDYWKDPCGFELEHWTDGDLLDNSHPPDQHSLEVLLGSQWGPAHPMLAQLQAQENASSET